MQKAGSLTEGGLIQSSVGLEVDERYKQVLANWRVACESQVIDAG